MIVSTLIAPTAAFSQTVYTWEDENGVLHFSDSPTASKNAKRAKTLTLPDHQASAPAPSFENLPTDPSGTPKANEKKKKPTARPEPLSLSFQSPQHDQTIRSNTGNFNIAAQQNRKLSVDEHLQLLFNDSRYGAPNTTGKWQLKNIDRGTHTISIQAFRDGKLIASSSTITVHLHRASIK
ncbi:DUF4124 domain-containing protein [Vibrio sp. ZSDE26]|uniref:DUF4124 domain-containing protein n=2 Tax=Vibrio amylolyticus TaxID=2847292 RepID=A0A9X1XPV4_9VIBR|nr:DUF4124 domain-containing protein [Vibrio amylolyticus]MCK6263334.1 DUF4124 domain-containing protein [Vibrio amylolyticus]